MVITNSTKTDAAPKNNQAAANSEKLMNLDMIEHTAKSLHTGEA